MAEVAALAGLAQAGSKLYQGDSEKSLAYRTAGVTEQAAALEAQGLSRRAMEERAAGQRQYQEQKLKEAEVISKQRAGAAASGAGASNAGILDLIGDTAARGEYLADTEMYKGESAARGIEDKAAAGTWQAGTRAASMRQKGDAAWTGSIFDAGITAATAGYKYGDRQGWWDDAKPTDKPDSDVTDLRSGWRTRVYKTKAL